jgi:hypothetical protein
MTTPEWKAFFATLKKEKLYKIQNGTDDDGPEVKSIVFRYIYHLLQPYSRVYTGNPGVDFRLLCIVRQRGGWPLKKS